MATITIDDAVYAEFEYMVSLYKEHGCPCGVTTVDELVRYILCSVADGSRRPGSWERSLLEPMGILADCPEHQAYRAGYGRDGQKQA